MTHIKRYSQSLLLVMITLIVGCASQQTPRELLASGYSVVEVAALTTARLQSSGLITPIEAQATKADLQGVQTTLNNAAAALKTGNPADAHATIAAALSTAVSILERVQVMEAAQ